MPHGELTFSFHMFLQLAEDVVRKHHSFLGWFQPDSLLSFSHRCHLPWYTCAVKMLQQSCFQDGTEICICFVTTFESCWMTGSSAMMRKVLLSSPGFTRCRCDQINISSIASFLWPSCAHFKSFLAGWASPASSRPLSTSSLRHLSSSLHRSDFLPHSVILNHSYYFFQMSWKVLAPSSWSSHQPRARILKASPVQTWICLITAASAPSQTSWICWQRRRKAASHLSLSSPFLQGG